MILVWSIWFSILELNINLFLFSKSSFSQALSHPAYFMLIPWLVLNLQLSSTSHFSILFILSKKNPCKISAVFYDQQFFPPPKVGVKGDLMSKNSLSPKTLSAQKASYLHHTIFTRLKCTCEIESNSTTSSLDDHFERIS